MKETAKLLWSIAAKAISGLLVILTCWIASTLRDLELGQTAMSARIESLTQMSEIRMVWFQEELNDLECRVAEVEKECRVLNDNPPRSLRKP